MPKLPRSKFEEEAAKAVIGKSDSFDPFFFTEKCMDFGKALTGITLYKYQYDPVFRTIYSLLTFEAASITMLNARQCVDKDSIIHTRDGRLVKISEADGAWKTMDNAEVYRVTSDLGHFVEGTSNHPVKTRNGYKNIENLTEGDEIACLVSWDKFVGKDRAFLSSTMLDPTQSYVEWFNEMSRTATIKFLQELTYISGSFSKQTRLLAPDYDSVKALREVLNKLGFPCAITHKPDVLNKNNYYCYFTSGAVENVYLDFIRSSDPRNYRLNFNYDFIGEDGEFYAYCRINTIEKIGKKEVWDITVPEKHWFTCGGINVHNSGKTEGVTFLTTTTMVLLPALGKFVEELDYFTQYGMRAGIFAPHSDQVDTLYSRIKTKITSDNALSIMSDSDINTGINKISKLTLTNHSFCTAQIASKQSKIEGNTLDLAIMDEAQDIDTLIAEKSIEPMCTATAGTVLRTGTVSRTKNHFYSEIQHNKREDKKKRDQRLLNHYQYDYKVIIEKRREQYNKDGKKYHLNYERFVKMQLKKHGEKSDAFAMSYALKWKFEDGMFCPEERLKTILDKRKSLEFNRDIDHEHYAFGIDWAKENANTVLTILKVTPDDAVYETKEEYAEAKPLKELVRWVEFEGTDYESQHMEIMEYIYEFLPTYVASDSTGVGNAPTDRLMYAVPSEVMVIPYVFSRPSKSELWTELDADISKKRITIPASKSVRESNEFIHFEEQITNAVKYYVGAHFVVHKSEGFKDDYLDSLGLANHAANLEVVVEDEADAENNFLMGDYYEKIQAARNASW